MPTVTFDGTVIDCDRGVTIRECLVEAGYIPHNGQAERLNCRGHGTCGTCAVAIEGDASSPTARERWRLDFPPHDPTDGLRLACQTTVEGDLVVEKYPGFWGQHTDEPPVTDDS